MTIPLCKLFRLADGNFPIVYSLGRHTLFVADSGFCDLTVLITDAATEICRLAWLPDDDTLLRVEAGVTALQPMIVEEDMMIGFEPPALSSLRCDMMKKVGELEDALRPSRDWGKGDQQISRESEKISSSKSEDKSIKEETRGASNKRNSNAKEKDQTNDQKPIRDSLSL